MANFERHRKSRSLGLFRILSNDDGRSLDRRFCLGRNCYLESQRLDGSKPALVHVDRIAWNCMVD